MTMELDPKHVLFLKAEGRYILAGGTTATERELTTWVTDVAKAAGWLTHHNPDSRRVPPGIPDLILLRPPQLLFIELKKLGRASKLREEQKQWINGLQRCGQEALVWTPNEIPTIWERLTGLPFET
jgi:VRR-NUC domain